MKELNIFKDCLLIVKDLLINFSTLLQGEWSLFPYRFSLHMKRLISFFLFLLISISIFGQKVSIRVTHPKQSGLTDWRIFDNTGQIVFTGSEYLVRDTVTFNLEANQIYFLSVTISDTVNSNRNLLTLYIKEEPILFIKSGIGTGTHKFPFFSGIKSINAKITGGSTALISDFPWQIYFISGNFRCGGSIISNRWILTAAHCTKNSSGGAIPANQMFVQVGANDPGHNPAEGKRYAVSQAIVHEGYNDQTLLNDIALLRLVDTINFANAKPIKLVKSVDVAEGAILPGVVSWVTGWGYTNAINQTLPTTLQKVQLPIVTNAQAETVWGTIPATDLMAGFLNGNRDACNGDSGGPLVVPVLDEFKLAGIVSWGSDNCDTYGAYTRVSDFEQWIKTNTGIQDNFVPPDPRGDSVICQGTSSDVYSIPVVPGATSYEWKILPLTAGTITGNFQNASVLWNPGFTGRVNIIVRVTIGGKLSDWGRLDATISPITKILSIPKDTEVPFGGDISLTINAQGHDLVYQWIKDGSLLEVINNPKLSISNVKATDIGIYRVNVSGSCGSELSDSIYVYVKRSDNSGDPQVFIWPSLTTGEFSIALNDNSVYNVEIFNTRGSKVAEQLKCRFQTRMNISHLAGGMYIVEVYNSSFRKSIRIIKV